MKETEEQKRLRLLANGKKYRDSHSEQEKARTKKYRDSHREEIRARNRKLYHLNIEKERARNREKDKLNPGAKNARTAKRRATKLQATPKWLNSDQLLEIRWFYKTAKEIQWLSEQPLEVDHIIPLQGKDVCGLHVPWNLQIIPEKLNQSKGNKT